METRSEDGTSVSKRQRTYGGRQNALGMQPSPFLNPSLREKLVDVHNLTKGEVDQIVGNMGRGWKLDNISKLNKSIMDAIKQVEFVDLRRDN